jgi:ATP-dependent DNA ligase
LDGIRCIAKADGLWSRKNTPITAVPHIWEALKPLFQKDPTLILDGELYNHVLNADFNSIVSMVRKHAPTESELMVAKALVQYHVYDLPSSSGSFSQRNKELLSLLSASPSCIVLVHTDKASNQADLDAQYDHYLSNSYEGQMVRVDAKYELKRSKTLLKRKESQDNEYTVLDIVEGTGNRAGMVGHVVVDLGGGKTCNPNPKGTREFLREVLANKAKYIGKQATVEFFGFTPDKNLRFPRVKAFHLNGRI